MVASFKLPTEYRGERITKISACIWQSYWRRVINDWLFARHRNGGTNK